MKCGGQLYANDWSGRMHLDGRVCAIPHMTRHTAGIRVDRIFPGHAPLGQLIGQLLLHMLCPCYRQAVTRNDDHGVGVGKQKGHVASRAGFYRRLCPTIRESGFTIEGPK
ncbi:hypothetical protein D3C80_1398500 [compost metagenome]